MIEVNSYLKPKTVEEAIAFAQDNRQSFRYISGGTDFLVNKFQGNEKPACIIDLSGIEDLHNINRAGGLMHIGSMLRLEELSQNKIILDKFPALIEAIQSIATPMIRKTATVGGNLLCENRCAFYNQSEWWRDAIGYCLKCDGDICIATGGKKNCFSKFSSDLAPLLISLDATINIIDHNGGFICALEDIYTGNGLTPRKLENSSILTAIHLPLVNNYTSVFKKLRTRNSLDFTSLTTAVSMNDGGKIKIVIGGVDPKPIVVRCSKKDDTTEVIAQTIKKARIVENDIFSRSYRKEMIKVFLTQSFEELEMTPAPK
ncbi:xanthine dehydrogenase family protein subunit M [soil metagenome]